MATIDIVCPSCQHASKAPAELKGKKLRCKRCKNVFVVGAVAAEAARVQQHLDAEIDRNPYGVTTENLAARCPFCAMAMDPPDARICLHCGYDMVKRRRLESRNTYETTALDYMLWHLPTVACFIGIFVVIGFCIFCGWNMADWTKETWFDEIIPPGCYTTWLSIVGIALIWFQGKFVFKRLVYNLHPPEKIKKVKKE